MSGYGDILTLCSVCGFSVPMKEVFSPSDPFSKYHGLVVCRECYLPTNDQKKPYTVIDKPRINPKLYRSYKYPDNYRYSEVDTGRLPSAPRDIRISINSSGGLLLRWEGPLDPAGGVISYRIVRAFPQLGVETTLSGYEGAGAAWFKDTSADVEIEYSYTVYASNSYGEGPASLPAYWPIQQVNQGIIYILDGDDVAILDGNGDYILDGAST